MRLVVVTTSPFRWIKQNLRTKTFYGTSENAVKAQIWIAVSLCVLVAIMKKWLKIEASLYTILQVLSVTIFECYCYRQSKVQATETKLAKTTTDCFCKLNFVALLKSSNK